MALAVTFSFMYVIYLFMFTAHLFCSLPLSLSIFLFPISPSSTFRLSDLFVVVVFFVNFYNEVCFIRVFYKSMGEGLLQEYVTSLVVIPLKKASLHL